MKHSIGSIGILILSCTSSYSRTQTNVNHSLFNLHRKAHTHTPTQTQTFEDTRRLSSLQSNTCCNKSVCFKVGETNNIFLPNGTSIGTCNSCKTCSRMYNERGEQTLPKEDRKDKCAQYYVEYGPPGNLLRYPCVWDDSELYTRKRCTWNIDVVVVADQSSKC